MANNDTASKRCSTKWKTYERDRSVKYVEGMDALKGERVRLRRFVYTERLHKPIAVLINRTRNREPCILFVNPEDRSHYDTRALTYTIKCNEPKPLGISWESCYRPSRETHLLPNILPQAEHTISLHNIDV